MPLYDYQCADCKHAFVVVESLSQHEKTKEHKCPECGSSNVERIITSVSVHTAKKS